MSECGRGTECEGGALLQVTVRKAFWNVNRNVFVRLIWVRRVGVSWQNTVRGLFPSDTSTAALNYS